MKGGDDVERQAAAHQRAVKAARERSAPKMNPPTPEQQVMQGRRTKQQVLQELSAVESGEFSMMEDSEINRFLDGLPKHDGNGN